MHVTFLHISDYIRYFTVALQVCVSGVSHLLLAKWVCGSSFPRKWHLPVQSLCIWGVLLGLFLSQLGAQLVLIAIAQSIDSFSQGLIWCSVMWGIYIPSTSVSMRGWLLSTVQGRGDPNGQEVWEGVERTGEAGTDFFFPGWLCYGRTTGLGIWISPPLSTGSEFRVFMM